MTVEISAKNREQLLCIYLSKLEKAKFELSTAEKSLGTSSEPLDKLHWSLEAEARRALVCVYDGLVKFLQATEM